MSSDTVTDKIGLITNSALFRRVVIALILVNAIIVGLDIYPGRHAPMARSFISPITSFSTCLR